MTPEGTEVPGKWAARPLPKFILGPRAISGRKPCVLSTGQARRPRPPSDSIDSSMCPNDKCVKCGCGDIIQRAVVESTGSRGGWHELQVRVDAHPDAVMFHKAVRSAMSARVCSGCGHVEFYATDTDSLRKALLESRSVGPSIAEKVGKKLGRLVAEVKGSHPK